VKCSLQKYCVYAHRKRGKIFYIGSGVPSRAFAMLRSKQWLKQAKGASSIEIHILRWFDNRKAAYDYEAQLVRKHLPPANVIKFFGQGWKPANRVFRIRKCLKCGTIFRPVRRWQKFHSPVCRWNAWVKANPTRKAA
jgi:hypothetical protein